MPFDEASLAKDYDVISYSVSSSTKISGRAGNIITGLEAQPEGPAKPKIIKLHAGVKASSKIISIVEIAKRDLVSKGTKVFQYTALSSDIVDIDRVPKRKGDAAAGEGEKGDESDDAFETMGVGQLSEKKKREMPNLTVYLSLQSVKELRNEYG